MLEQLVGVVAIVGLVVFAWRQHTRLGLLEREVRALRSFVLAGPPALQREAPVEASAEVVSEQPDIPAAASTVAEDVPEAVAAATGDPETMEAGPWSPPAEPEPKRPDLETALGTRWAVWVGGLALALGGLFLVRYSIEAGVFGPGVRLTFAALLGLALVGGGEFIRRTGFKVPVEGAAAAYVPGVLTAAGAFTLFGAVYAAHGVYGFIGPALAFTLMGVVGVGTIAAALVHGQALAGVGLLGSLITPMLVSSQSPNAWALFGYLAIVLAANTMIARLRDWNLVAAAGFAGTGLWCLLYMMDSATLEPVVVVFINAVMLSALALIWLGWRILPPRQMDWPSVASAFTVALAALALLVDRDVVAAGGELYGVVLAGALVAVAFYRPAALPLLHAAGVAAVLVQLRHLLSGSFSFEMMGEEVTIDGLGVLSQTWSPILIGFLLTVLFLGSCLYSGWKMIPAHPRRAAIWTGWGALVPLAALFSLWIAFGDIGRDLGYAAAALVLGAILIAAGEAMARREHPPLTGGLAVSCALGGAAGAVTLMLHMAFGPLWTTMLVGLLASAVALATRYRSYPALGWICVGAVLVVMARAALDPTIVGGLFLGTTPVFNALLPGYGVPALAFGFAAWQLARTTGGRPRLVMEAGAALFALLTAAMLVRHAMNGGVIEGGAPTLGEQAIYTLIALGAGAILVALDTRSPSPVLRLGSIAAGVASAAFIVAQHIVLLNPLFTDEGTGSIPVFNLLLLAYLLPALAAGWLALYIRGKRPKWYSQMLALMGAMLAFFYATLSLRRLFQGEHIGLWAGMDQLEAYSYSALWLAMGVGMLVLGVRFSSHVLRVASAVLIALAVAKVFIFDMSGLEGMLRALSFIGLGAVLIGIGLFYQRLLTRAGKAEPAAG